MQSDVFPKQSNSITKGQGVIFPIWRASQKGPNFMSKEVPQSSVT